MAFYLLRYDSVVEDYANRRTPFRAEHLQMVRDAHARGEIVMAGAVGEVPSGALLVFRGESSEVAERFAAADPYVKHGLILSWRVQPWHVVVGAGA
jgi:hypothetical protein